MGTDEDFHALVSGLEYPMFIVTAATAAERSGCLVGFVTQASIDPPRLLVLLSRANRTFRVAQRTDSLAVHFLHEHNHELGTLFGEQTGDEVDKFAACSWHEGPGGVPVLAGTRGWVVGRVVARFDAGDHVAHLLEVDGAQLDLSGRQLGFQAVRDMEPGHPS